MSLEKYPSIYSRQIEAIVYLERCSIESRKTKTLANHKGQRQYSEPIKTRSYYMQLTQSAEKRVGVVFGFESTSDWMKH